jgi:hypothetical protein
MSVAAIGFTSAPGNCQRAGILVDATGAKVEMKTMTSADLKAAVAYAVQSGDLDAKDGKELIDKITDIETLMDQFDFIREQERRMVSSIGSSFH